MPIGVTIHNVVTNKSSPDTGFMSLRLQAQAHRKKG